MKEISPNEFPKALAIQNMSFGGRYFMTDRQRDKVQLARDLDTQDISFRRSLTAKIWYHLLTGQQYFQAPNTIDEALLADFIRKHQPDRLTFFNYFQAEAGDSSSLLKTNTSSRQP